MVATFRIAAFKGGSIQVIQRRPPNGQGSARETLRFKTLSQIHAVYWALCGLLLLLGMLVSPAQADELDFNEQWNWSHFTTAEGLPSNRITAITEANNGTMWVSTTAGLAWYDGYRWIPTSCGSNVDVVTATFIWPAEEKGIYAIFNAKLYRVEKHGQQRIPTQYEGRDLLVQKAVVTNEHGLVLMGKFSREKGRHLLRRDGSGWIPLEMLPMKNPEDLFDIWGDGLGLLWLHAGEGLYCYIDEQWKLHLPTDSPPGQVLHLQSSSGEGLVALNKSIKGRGLWSWRDGEEPKLVISEKYGRIEALASTHDNTVMAVYDSEEIFIREEGFWQPMNPVPSQLRGIRALTFRSNNDLYVGTDRGLAVFHHSDRLWEHWRNPSRESENRVNDFLLASDQSIWIASDQGLEIHHSDGSTQRISELLGRPIFEATGLAQDGAGNIYLTSGSGFEGAFQFDGKQWRYFGPEDGLPGYQHRVRADRQGNVWFLGLETFTTDRTQIDTGATRLDANGFFHYTTRNGLINDRVYAFAQGLDGALWFGTYKGLCRQLNGQWTYWTKAEGLRQDRIWSIAIDLEGKLWFADQRNGLGSIENDRPVYLTIEHGLSDNLVQEVRADPLGGIWMSSRGGITRYHQGRWYTFNAADGIGHSSLWPILPLTDRVLVGTLGQGTAILDRQVLDALDINIEIENPVISENTLAVRWNVAIREAFSRPDTIETRYRVGAESWSEWSDVRMVTLPITPGSHTFAVQGRSRFAQSPFAQQSYVFSAPYPIYLHPLFLILTLGFLLIIAVLVLLSITRQRKANENLRESEKRFRHMAESSPLMIWVSDANRNCVYFNKAMLKFRGRSLEQELDGGWLEGVHPEDIEALKAELDRTSKERVEYRTEYRMRNSDGEYRWLTDCGTPRFTPAGEFTGYIGSCYDMTELKQAHDVLDLRVADRTRELACVNDDLKAQIAHRQQIEEELHRKNEVERLLFSELDHRVRNNLSSLIAMLQISKQGARSVDEYARSIRERIEAMAAVHGILSKTHWAGMNMCTLIKTLIPPGRGDMIEISGEIVEIPSRQATAFGMVIHELFTNSLKHGSLGTENGQLTIAWKANDHENGAIQLQWTWSERGQTIEVAKINPGVGTSIIEGLIRSELRGTVNLNFQPSGVTHEFTMNLDQIE